MTSKALAYIKGSSSITNHFYSNNKTTVSASFSGS